MFYHSNHYSLSRQGNFNQKKDSDSDMELHSFVIDGYSNGVLLDSTIHSTRSYEHDVLTMWMESSNHSIQRMAYATADFTR